MLTLFGRDRPTLAGDGLGADRNGVFVLKDLGSLSGADVHAQLGKLGEREGYYRRLGDAHSVLFMDRGPTLVVTFETSRAIARQKMGGVTFGQSIAEPRNWSHLCLIADSESWFRAPEVYAYFDDLVDEAFFEEYDQVVFYGSGMAAYAAAAYSVAAPGATVILIQPQATLDPTVAGWDPRFSEHRRLCFTDRYGFAPDMTEGAGQVFVLYDPEQSLDAMHAALFKRPFTTLLPCRHLGADIAGDLLAMHILPSVLSAAATGTFDAGLFWTFFRARRNHLPYLKRLLRRLESDGRPGLGAMLARNTGQRLNDPQFITRAEELSRQIEDALR